MANITLERGEITADAPKHFRLYDACKHVSKTKSFVQIRPREDGDGVDMITEFPDLGSEAEEQPWYTGLPHVKTVDDASKKRAGYILLDMFTSNAFVQIYEALSPESQAKMDGFGVLRQIDVMWKLVAKCAK